MDVIFLAFPKGIRQSATWKTVTKSQSHGYWESNCKIGLSHGLVIGIKE